MASTDAAFRRLVEAFEKLKIPFYVGGSVASSIHGVARATMDVGVVASIQQWHIQALVRELGQEFYVDPDLIGQALQRRRAFNLIHFSTSYKFDVFPLTEDPFQAVQYERRIRKPVSLAGEEEFEVPLASPEDTLLNKLAWYRGGGETSDRQWNDIRGIVTVQGDRLDRGYMGHWACYLKVEDLLARALSE
jgi:hypothetical protein